eukprot:6312357-Lingulodinium_polyedra.AAC.1
MSDNKACQNKFATLRGPCATRCILCNIIGPESKHTLQHILLDLKHHLQHLGCSSPAHLAVSLAALARRFDLSWAGEGRARSGR